MTKQQHAPGPWNQRKAVASQPTWHVHTPQFGRVASVYTEANARLIAAAPDLLAALERVVTDPAFENGSTPLARRMAAEAIAKARGEG